MKKMMKSALCLGMLVVVLAGCTATATDLWADATYVTDTTLGQGQKTVTVEVKAEDKAVTLTVHTDKATLGEALTEHGLIAGEPGAYGLYVKQVNGITADYDVDKAYWAFYEGDQYAMTGVDTTVITGGEHYALVYTKE